MLRTLILLLLALESLAQASAPTTNFLDHEQLLRNVEDPAWFQNNVPIIDLPDQEVLDVYYYRWESYKEHLLYTGPQYGYLSTEFLQPVGYGGPYGGIVAAAGHHINEGRWLRSSRPGKDLVDFWLAGPGAFYKPSNYDLNPDTTDWAHQYSFWAASTVWRQYLATGDKDFAIGELDNLVRYYDQYDNHFNSTLGLYWQAPVWDASEYTAASYNDPADPYHGGYGFRPTINSYQYGDARAIASLARLKGDDSLANQYDQKADLLRSATQTLLWDDQDKFFKHRARGNNPTGALLKDREIMGYLPWMFNLPDDEKYSEAFSQLLDARGFSSVYGPTTLENRSDIFYKDATTGCCHWDGPSWPFATSQTLTAVENLLNDYPKQDYITADDYFTLLKRYVLAQFKNGKPYIAEAHDAYKDAWIYDSPGHSKDYNHSTFIDNLIAGLLGIRAQPNDTLTMNPLTPSTWPFFAIENLPYHSHLLTILYSNTTKSSHPPGLHIYLDANQIYTSPTLPSFPLTLPIPSFIPPTLDKRVNMASNPLRTPTGPQPFASYTSPYDSPWRVVDGLVLRTAIGGTQNSRWTSYLSSNESDYWGVLFGREQGIEDVRVWFYDDADGVRFPGEWEVEVLGGGGEWVVVEGQEREGVEKGGVEIRVTFPVVRGRGLRVTGRNGGGGVGWGLSEVQIWGDADFVIRGLGDGMVLEANRNGVGKVGDDVESTDDGRRWEIVKPNDAGGWSTIRNIGSDAFLSVGNDANHTVIMATEQAGDATQLWKVIDKGDGQGKGNANGHYAILNKATNLVLTKHLTMEPDTQPGTALDDGKLWELISST